jgi:hypothetical protein
VAQSLCNLQIFVIHPPVYKINADTKLQAINDINYKLYMDHFIVKSLLFQSNMGMAYSLIQSKYCSKALLNQGNEEIKIDPSIRDDPVKLLSTIRVLMQESVRAQYPYVTFVDTLITCLTVKQFDTKSLVDYSKWFKQHKGILKQMMGTKFMDYWVSTQPAYKTLSGSDAATVAKHVKLKDAAFSNLTSYFFIKGADPNKYGSFLDGFTTQFSLGSNQWNDQWPKTTEACMKVLSALLDGRKSSVVTSATTSRTPKNPKTPSPTVLPRPAMTNVRSSVTAVANQGTSALNALRRTVSLLISGSSPKERSLSTKRTMIPMMSSLRLNLTLKMKSPLLPSEVAEANAGPRLQVNPINILMTMMAGPNRNRVFFSWKLKFKEWS